MEQFWRFFCSAKFHIGRFSSHLKSCWFRRCIERSSGRLEKKTFNGSEKTRQNKMHSFQVDHSLWCKKTKMLWWLKQGNKKKYVVSIIQSYFESRPQDCWACACSPKWIVVRNDKNYSSMYILQMYWSNLRDLTFYSYTIIKRIVIDTFSLKDYFYSY